MLFRNFLIISFITVVTGITWPWADDERNPYEPYMVDCPANGLVREADGINDQEKQYITSRQEKTNDHLIDFLENVAQLHDFDASDFIHNHSSHHNISIGLAFSGGGYRAMLSGAGQILALDDRYDDSIKKGLGGILQSSSYISGLSGGSWLLGSLILNNWTSVWDIINGETDIWHLDDSIFNPNGINIFKTGQYYTNIGTAINAKTDAGFPASITDIWGRALSYQFMSTTNGGENITWSSIENLTDFKNFNIPFPIILANGRYEYTRIIDLNSTVFEITPFELGSWDPTLNAFVETKYLGTYLDNGKSNSTNSCVINYDNAGFLMGTSSSIMNQFLTRLDEYGVPSYLQGIVSKILGRVDRRENDIAVYKPNPFLNTEFVDRSGNLQETDTLRLVDGGEDQQNIPLYPLIQQHRDVDVIFAFDNSADDALDWPNGSSIIHTFTRQFYPQGKGSPIPFVPIQVEDFIDLKFNEDPVFFGCDVNNLDDLVTLSGDKDMNSSDIPLIIHIPNRRMSFNANTSTFKLSYDDDEKVSMIQNGFEVSSRNNLSDDRQWPTCIGCAIIRRSQQRLDLEPSDECKKCFENYCWEPPKHESWVQSISRSAADARESSTLSGDSTKSTSEIRASTTVPATDSNSATSLRSSSPDSTTTTSSSMTTGSNESSRDGARVMVPSSLLLIISILSPFI